MPADHGGLRAAHIKKEDQHMSRSSVDELAGRDRAVRVAGGADPTTQERDAAAAVLQMIWGIHISRAVHVAAALGIADLLADGPATVAQLARAVQAHEPSLCRGPV
jgi:hypothetical protein